MMLAAIVSVTACMVVAFVVGYFCGHPSGKREARIDAFNSCIDFAALAMKGHPSWRYLSAADALLRAATLIGGNDVMPPCPPESRGAAVAQPSSARPLTPATAFVAPPILSKGNQA